MLEQATTKRAGSVRYEANGNDFGTNELLHKYYIGYHMLSREHMLVTLSQQNVQLAAHQKDTLHHFPVSGCYRELHVWRKDLKKEWNVQQLSYHQQLTREPRY